MFFAYTALAQISVNPVNTAYLSNYLSGSGVAISNLIVNCDSAAYGQMTSNLTSFPMTDGLLLSTGNAQQIANPASFFASSSYNTLGDLDISSSVGYQSYDACALEFDAVPAFGNIYFEYVWGSEEYPEFICNFNDAFLLLISGPGINGNYSGNAQNIAILPDSNTIVSINTVHDNTVGVNCLTPFDSLYVDNSNDTLIVYDGYTQLLTAGIQLVSGNTYHLKIVVADVMDGIFDSGVCLLQNSFRSVGTTAIANDFNLNTINIYPNPSADGSFFIKNPLGHKLPELILMDYSGQQVPVIINQSANQTRVTPIQHTPGIYLLKIGNTYHKVVIN